MVTVRKVAGWPLLRSLGSCLRRRCFLGFRLGLSRLQDLLGVAFVPACLLVFVSLSAVLLFRGL